MIEEILVKALRLAPGSVGVLVTEGVVTPDGRRERGNGIETAVAVALARRTDGVVGAADEPTGRTAPGPGPAPGSRTTRPANGRDTAGRRS
ncbi:hypothetical protein L1856_03920 [Streptomyces sp. Tue 6430]|nr:hypothetical protein [Streptomyces sp. Tue 6430]